MDRIYSYTYTVLKLQQLCKCYTTKIVKVVIAVAMGFLKKYEVEKTFFTSL